VTPLCTCHGEPMAWNTSARYRAGGFWRCRIRKQKKDRVAYARDPETKMARVRAYELTDKGRAARRRSRLGEQTRRRSARIDHYKELTHSQIP
jgi:hypothetical protein